MYMEVKNVVYVGNFSFPDQNAAGKRVYGISLSLRDIGYKVTIIDTKKIADKKELSQASCNIDGFDCYSLRYPIKTTDWLNFYSYFNEVKVLLDELVNQKDIDFLIYYGSPTLSFFDYMIVRYCKRNNIKVISDCVDWLSVTTSNPMRDVIKRLDDNFQKKFSNKSCDGVICISQYLADYYRSKGVSTVIIPPTAKSSSLRLNDIQENGVRRLFYAGFPFRNDMKVGDVGSMKDRIDLIISNLATLKRQGYSFIFNVYGISRNDIVEHLPMLEPMLEELQGNVNFHGVVSNSIILNELKKSDFTLLIRDDKRDSIAGFPSKIAESISVGVPVVVTDNGDINTRLVSGRHAFVCRSHDDDSQLNGLKQALSISNEDLQKMKKHCLDDKIFSFERYTPVLKEFMESL